MKIPQLTCYASRVAEVPFWESNEYSITSSRTATNTYFQKYESSTIPIPYMTPPHTNSHTLTPSKASYHRIISPKFSAASMQSQTTSKHVNTNYIHFTPTSGGSPLSMTTPSKDTFKSRYNDFHRKWNRMVRARQYKECERLCNKTIDAINPIINHQNKRHNDRNYKLDRSAITELKGYRSQIRHLYGVLCYKWLDDIGKALKQYELALMDDQNNSYAHCNLATLYRRGEYQEFQLSEMHYKKAIELNPKNGRFHYNYALLLQHSSVKQYSNAKQQYIVALKCNPNYIKCHSKLAHLYGML